MRDFNSQIADLLHLRVGEAIQQLRQKNKKYNLLLRERAEIIKRKHTDYADLHSAYTKLIELTETINDIEQNYLFLCGLLEQRKLHDILTSDDFLRDFTGL